jgi:flagellar hook-associated protein 2
MGVSGIQSYQSQSTNKRVTGLVSNMDTDALVKAAMKNDTDKYNKILQKRGIDEWKIDAYRDVTSTLQGFYKDYFDTLASKKLKSEDSFASFAATYGTTTATDYVSVTPGAAAKAGTYSITKLKAATAANISGSNASKAVECLEITDASVANINYSNNNNAFVISLNGITKEITLDGTGLTSVQQLQQQLQNKLDDAFGTDASGRGKITVGYTAASGGGKLSFSPVRATDTFTIGTDYNQGAGTLFSTAPVPTSPFVLNETNNKFDLTVGGVTKTITVASGATPKIYTDAASLAADIQTAAQAQFGSLSPSTFTASNGKVVYSGVTIDRAKDGTQAALGVNSFNLSNKLNLTSKISDMKNSLSTALNVSGGPGDIKFSVNGKFFTFDSTKDSINDIMKKVSADTTVNATMKYDITTNSLKIESRSSGATSKLVVEDVTGNLMHVLGADTSVDPKFNVQPTALDPFVLDTTNNKFQLTVAGVTKTVAVPLSAGDTPKTYTSAADLAADIQTASESAFPGLAAGTFTASGGRVTYSSSVSIGNARYGSDASVTINGTEIVRPSNSFSYDGLTFNVKNDFSNTTDPIKVTISSDPNKTFDFIKGFVDKYNEIIDKLNDKISEKRYKDYLPLTDEQESAMTDDQIKKWEEKAKSGLIKNDSIVSDILSKMRTALYASVQGTGISLAAIGITTSANYEDKGKLEINEAKLKDALANKPQEIATLFTANSDITYYDAINSGTSSTLRSQRYNESGIAQRFSDILQDAIRTNTDVDGNKGTLLEKAGIVGDRSEYQSVLAKEMLQFDTDAYDLNKKLVAKENALYQKYAAMESALNKLNSQQNQLSQMLG